MIEAFIILLREGIEVALIVGLMLVYLRKIDMSPLFRAIYWGLLTAVLVSIAGGILIKKFALDHEVLEGYLLLAAAVFVTTMVIWMWKKSKTVKNAVESRVDSITSGRPTWKMHLGLFSFSFLMVVREGIETAVFLQAVALTRDGWKVLIGSSLGFITAATFGILFFKGSVRVDIARFMKVTAVVLLIFVLQLLVNAIHEFIEFGVLPSSPTVMGIVGPIVRHNLLFLLAILSIPALMLIIPGRRGNEIAPSPLRHRRFQLTTGFATISVVFFLGFNMVFTKAADRDLETVKYVELNDGYIHIPLESIDDGKLHRYVWKDGSVEIRFFALRMGMKFATAFDACRACYDYARYYRSGDDLVCSKCDAPHATSFLRPSYVEEDINENTTGSMEGNGCAPIYLPSRIKNGEILISKEDIQAQRKYFGYDSQ
jgi:high-affinity iron transporter